MGMRPGKEERHYTEDELLLHLMEEEAAGARAAVSAHLGRCAECSAVLADFQRFRDVLSSWTLPVVPEETWLARKSDLLESIRREETRRESGNRWSWAVVSVRRVWDYAVNNPLPTLGYIAAAVAFASERTISLFRLDELLPATGEFLDIIRQVF